MDMRVLFSLFLIALIFTTGCVSIDKTEDTSTSTTSTTIPTTIQTTTQQATTTIPSTTTQATSSTIQSTTTTLWDDSCAVKSDCPEPFTSEPYCWTLGNSWRGGGDIIYIDEVSYVCSTRGLTVGRCAEKRERKINDTCKYSSCFNGECWPTQCFDQRLNEGEEGIDCGGVCPSCNLTTEITCFNDCDCLTREAQFYSNVYKRCTNKQITASEFIIEGRCRDYNIMQNLITYNCNKAGTIDSYCTSEVTHEMYTAECRDKNCTLDCRFKTNAYPNLAVILEQNVTINSIETHLS